jgi:hypothetical protein
MRADTVGFRTDDVQRLLDRMPRTFADWRRRNADLFRQPAAIRPVLHSKSYFSRPTRD